MLKFFKVYDQKIDIAFGNQKDNPKSVRLFSSAY